MKKFLVTVLIVLLIGTVFTACGSDNNNADGEESPTPAPALSGAENENGAATEAEAGSRVDDLGEFDFKGYEFKIANRVNSNFSNSFYDFEELTGEPYEDAVFMRNRAIEDRFNVKISVLRAETPDLIGRMVRSGVNDYDVYTIRNAEMFSYATEGLINSINDLPHIDLSKTYWDDFITDQLSMAGKKYFAVGEFDISSYDFAYVLVFNKQLMQDYGIESPYVSVKEGKWTLDKFAEMAKTGTLDLDGDNKMTDKDAWGYAARSNDVLPGFWVGAGVTGATKDEDDIPMNTMGSEMFINAIDKIFDVVHGNNIYYNAFEKTMFINGSILFNDVNLFQLKWLRAMETDFGILPYPKYNENQKNYYTRVGGNILFGTMKIASGEDLLRTSVILEAMASGSLDACVPAYYDNMLKTKLARDVDSEEILDSIVAHRVVDFIDNIWVDELRDGVLNTMFTSKNNNLVSRLERMEGIFDIKRNNMIEAFLALDN